MASVHFLGRALLESLWRAGTADGRSTGTCSLWSICGVHDLGRQTSGGDGFKVEIIQSGAPR